MLPLCLALLGLLPHPNHGARDGEGPAWTVIAPAKASSDGPTRLELQPDGSVLASGPVPERETLTLDFEGDWTGVTGLRLEALPDASLPDGGPGRAPGGLFQLTELRLGTSSLQNRRPRPELLLEAVDGDDLESGWPSYAIDDNRATAYGPARAVGGPCVAVFLLEGPLPSLRQGLLRVELVHDLGAGQSLGRLRLSVTTDPDPRAALGLDGDENRAAFEGQVQAAIGRGVDWLLSQQELDGSWRYQEPHYRSGAAALAAYTLLRCGLRRDHPSVERAIAYCLANPPDRTYTLGVQLMALGAHDPVGHRAAIERLTAELLGIQTRGWAYPTDPSTQVDLSNTQYAVLGLRAAALAGIDIKDKVWIDAGRQVLQHQERTRGSDPAAGFGYHSGDDPSGSLTAAGLTVLGVVLEHLERGTDAFEKGAAAGLRWLEREFTVTRNPRPSQGQTQHDQDKWWLYYLYGLERVAGLFDLDLVGPFDWYRSGAATLLERQQGNGSWQPFHNGEAAQEIPDTCFALLFLARATSAPATGQAPSQTAPVADGIDPHSGMHVRATGGAPWRAWLVDFGNGLRARHQWPDDGGLRVVEVRWERVDAAGQVLELLERVAGDPSRDEAQNRFAARLRLAEPGRHRLRATAVLLAPDGTQAEEHSAPLEVSQPFADHDGLLDYARGSAQNLLVGVPAEITASSALGGDWTAAGAVDGRQAFGWCSADGDPRPWWRIELERGCRADRLLLSQRQELWADDPWRSARVRKVAVSINGGRPLEVELNQSPWRKTEVDLGKTVKVDQLEVRVLETVGLHPAHPDHDGCGLAEIELVSGR
jgi:hypothetical protein